MTDWLNNLISNIFGNVGSTMTNAIWDLMLKWIYEQIFGALADFFTMINGLGAAMFDLSWVKAVTLFFSYFGWGLFIAGLIIAVFDCAIEAQSGRASIRATAINVIKAFMAVSLFTVVPIELYKFCITLQNTFSHDLIRVLTGDSNTNLSKLALDSLNGASLSSPTIMNLVLMIALGYCVIKIFFGNIKRGGILLTQIAVGSLHMFSVPRGYSDGFMSWCKQIFGLCLTSFMQTTLLFLGLLTWQTDLILGIGIMLAANEVPRIAQQFGLDTSAKGNMMSAVYATQNVINVTKNIAKVGAK